MNKLKVSSAKWGETNFKVAYKNEYTQDELPHALLKEAIIEELTYFNDHVREACNQEEMCTYKD